MSKEKFYVCYANGVSSKPYDDFIKNVFNMYDVEIINIQGKTDCSPNLVVFTGGEDVNPNRYNQELGKYTIINEKRDLLEENCFFNFQNTPKLGICRGAQFLTVMNGGTLIQHVENHANGPHSINFLKDYKDLNVDLPSTHHQMMYPFKLNKSKYELVAYSSYFRSGVYLNGNNKQIEMPSDFLEPEIVFYPNTKSLAIQPHPELVGTETIGFKVIKQTILNRLINNN